MRPGRAAAAWLARGLSIAIAASATQCASSGDCTEKAVCPGATGDDDSGYGFTSDSGPYVPATNDDSGGAGDDATMPVRDAAPPPLKDGGSIVDSGVDVGVPPGPDGCAPTEDCTDGLDNNCNGLADCADPACQAGFTCAAGAPAGWQGPVSLFEATGSPPAPSPACPSPFSTDAFDGNADPSAPVAVCACSCGVPTGLSCGPVSVSFYFDLSCNNLCAGSPIAVTPGNSCFAGCPGAQTARAVPSTATGGTCAGQLTKSIPTFSWGAVSRGCALAQAGDSGGCSSGSACVAKPGSPFLGSLCVWQAGDVACPGGAYTVKHLSFTGVDDSRDCTSCGCNAPTGVTCNVTVSTFTSGACPGSAAGTIPATGACVTAPGTSSEVQASGSSAGAGSCAPKAVSPTGSVTPTGPITACCGS